MKKLCQFSTEKCSVADMSFRDSVNKNGQNVRYYSITVVGYGWSLDVNIPESSYNGLKIGDEVNLIGELDGDFSSKFWRILEVRKVPEKKGA